MNSQPPGGVLPSARGELELECETPTDADAVQSPSNTRSAELGSETAASVSKSFAVPANSAKGMIDRVTPPAPRKHSTEMQFPTASASSDSVADSISTTTGHGALSSSHARGRRSLGSKRSPSCSPRHRLSSFSGFMHQEKQVAGSEPYDGATRYQGECSRVLCDDSGTLRVDDAAAPDLPSDEPAVIGEAEDVSTKEQVLSHVSSGVASSETQSILLSVDAAAHAKERDANAPSGGLLQDIHPSGSSTSESEGLSEGDEKDAPLQGSKKTSQHRHRKVRGSPALFRSEPGDSGSSDSDAAEPPTQTAAPIAMKGKGKAKGLSLLAFMPPPAKVQDSEAVPVPLPPAPGSPSKDASAMAPAILAEPKAPEAKAKAKGKGKGPGPPPPGAKAKAVEKEPEPEAGKAKGKGPPPPKAKGKGKGPPPPGEAKGKAPPPPKASAKAKAAGKELTLEQEKQRKAVAKVKPLGWHKLSAEEGTIWAELGCEDFDVSRPLIESLFAWGSSQGGKAARVRSDERKLCLTTEARAMGICIGLHPLKAFTLGEVRDAVLQLDGSVLSAGATDLLLTCDVKTGQPTVLPIVEEVAAAREFVSSGQSLDLLDDASKFLVAVHDIPSLHDRLLLHQFRGSFDSRDANLRSAIETMKSALLQVRSSKRFALILQLVLKLGNLLNDGTSRGEAQGFRMNTLLQLSQLKQAEPNSQQSSEAGGPGEEGEVQPLRVGGMSLTLLDTAVDILAVQKPELLDLAEDLISVPAAVRIELEDVGKEIQQLRGSLGRISKSANLKDANNSSSDTSGDMQTDVFQTLAPAFVSHAEAQLASLSEALADCKAVYIEVAVFFGEKKEALTRSGATPAHEWLGFINCFLTDLRRAVAAHQAHYEKERRRAKRKKKDPQKPKKQAEAICENSVTAEPPLAEPSGSSLKTRRVSGASPSASSENLCTDTSRLRVPSASPCTGSRNSSCSASFRLEGAGFRQPVGRLGPAADSRTSSCSASSRLQAAGFPSQCTAVELPPAILLHGTARKSSRASRRMKSDPARGPRRKQSCEHRRRHRSCSLIRNAPGQKEFFNEIALQSPIAMICGWTSLQLFHEGRGQRDDQDFGTQRSAVCEPLHVDDKA
eukprot:TRINITY_DN22418_c0_g2_i1.p1 TRINITY_DN22418_c0_g2~~TRINITY_DN22418_c0_g2_i1.p1  ORF type:complete len:1268 (-),score=256.04 TRINITY_DN22418_c0_g2_i1:265-3609(-)